MSEKFISSFEEQLEEMFRSVYYDLTTCYQKNDPEYGSLQKQYLNLFDKIQHKLGDGDKLLYRLEEAQNHMHSIGDDAIYLQGYIDCVTLLKKIGVI